MHLALIVCIKGGRVTDVTVVRGPNLGIGTWDTGHAGGIRLLLAEVKATTPELAEHAIWYAATKEHAEVCFSNPENFAMAWVRDYEMRQVSAGAMRLEDCCVLR